LISTAERDSIDFLDNIKEDAEQIEDEIKNNFGFLVVQGNISVFLVWYIPIVTFGILVSQFCFDDPPNTRLLKLFTILLSFIVANLARSLALNRVKSKIYIQTHFLIKPGDRFRRRKFQTKGGSYARPFVRYLVRQNRKRIRWERIEHRVKGLRIYYLRSKFEIFKWSFFLFLATLLSLIIALKVLDSLFGL
jgi:hypothetical protein